MTGRFLRAALVSAFFNAGILGAMILILGAIGMPHTNVTPMLIAGLPIAAFAFAVPATLLSFAGLIVVGLPAHALLQHAGLRSLWHYLGAGAVGAVFIALLTALTPNTPEQVATRILGWVVSPIACLVCAGVFWSVRRPDEDEPNLDRPTP